MSGWRARGRVQLARFLAEDFAVLVRWPRRWKMVRGRARVLH